MLGPQIRLLHVMHVNPAAPPLAPGDAPLDLVEQLEPGQPLDRGLVLERHDPQLVALRRGRLGRDRIALSTVGVGAGTLIGGEKLVAPEKEELLSRSAPRPAARGGSPRCRRSSSRPA